MAPRVVAEACAPDEFCEGCKPETPTARKKRMREGDPERHVAQTADPSSQSVMGGDVPFLPAMVDLNIDGTDVTGYAEVARTSSTTWARSQAKT